MRNGTLILIPARAGSKGLPGKNTKLLNGKPLISYSIEFAIDNASTNDEICVSSDDNEVLKITKEFGVLVPFVRPSELASDNATTYDVVMHALNHYKQIGREFEAVLLLQPTSPFRLKEDFNALVATFAQGCDMAVTVKEVKENPYFTLFEDNNNGFLIKSKNGDFERRQDCPKVYAYNGSMYLMKATSLLAQKLNEFKRIKKVLMPESRSIDIDTMADWVAAEYYSKID